MSLRHRLWPNWPPGHDPHTTLWDLWESVQQEFPDRVMGIDRFPANVSDSHRYAPLELSYRVDRHAQFDSVAQRFLQVLDLLWVYGPTYAETQHPYEDSLDELESPLRETVENLLARPKDEPLPLERVDDHEMFRNLATLGVRGIVPSVFVFAAHDMVLWQNEVSHTLVYLGQLDYLPTLQIICTTSGLFLRR